MINYRFTAVPSTLMRIMDNDCYKMIALLIEKENYWKEMGKLNNGYFYICQTDIEEVLMISRREIPYIIEALFQNNIIEVISEKAHTNRFRINWNTINNLSKLNIEEIRAMGFNIKKLKRGSKLSYTCTTSCQSVAKPLPKCPTTIDELDILDKLDILDNNINYINKEINKENILINNDEFLNEIKLNNNLLNDNIGLINDSMSNVFTVEEKEDNSTQKTTTNFNSLTDTDKWMIDTFIKDFKERVTEDNYNSLFKEFKYKISNYKNNFNVATDLSSLADYFNVGISSSTLRLAQ